MKRFLLFLALMAALVSCNKESLSESAKFDGIWAWTETYSGGSWKENDITVLYVFDGKGNYTLRNSKDGKGAKFQSGVIQNTEDSFVADASNKYTCTVSGTTYNFSSEAEPEYSYLSTITGGYLFSKSVGGKTIKYKFKKVTAFLSPEEIDPDDGQTRIAHTVILPENNIAGRLIDSQTGKGIADVAVSDGYTVVKTDKNGVYQFKSNELTRLVYYSTPAQYKVMTEDSNPSVPLFYKAIKPVGNTLIRTDFVLSPLPEIETEWTFVGIGDPQCGTASNASRYSTETLPDIVSTLSGFKNVYAATLGDITFDSTDMWATMKKSMSTVRSGSNYIPFFQCIGNHDHDSKKSDTSDNAMDDYNATSTFVSYFGPTDYSFNRGDVHIVVMDDIMVTSQSSSSRSNGRTWGYSGGFTDKQISWLRQDLDAVPNKEEKMVFICCHIQFRNSSSNNYPTVLTLLEQFKEAHIMIGHTHYTQNYVYSNSSGAFRKGKGGLALYEHIHGSACGAWWTGKCSSTVTGEPSGYTVYQIQGAHIKDWQLKGTRKAKDYQLRVFDGNSIYYSSRTYPLNWYTASQALGTLGFSIKGNSATKGCFVAQVFNDDDTYWKVGLYNKTTNQKIGDFTRITNGNCANIAMAAYYFNILNKKSDSYISKTASHYWYYKPSSGAPTDQKDWEVRATHTLPGGTATHTYTCSAFSTESTFATDFYF